MKKIILCITLILLTSGCTVEYNLYIDDSFTENITVNFNEEPYSSENVLSFFGEIGNSESNEKSEGLEYYTLATDYTNKISSYIYKFNRDDYSISNSANSCYSIFNVEKNDGIYTLKTNSTNNCFNDIPVLEEIVIRIHDTDNRVISSNTNNINNVYTWTIDKSNFFNSNIEITLDYSDFEDVITDDNYIEDNTEHYFNNNYNDQNIDSNYNDSNTLLYVFIIVFIFFCLLITLIYFINKNIKKK